MSNLTTEQRAAMERLARDFAATILPIQAKWYDQAQSNGATEEQAAEAVQALTLDAIKVAR
jgi:hypothetical protein